MVVVVAAVTSEDADAGFGLALASLIAGMAVMNLLVAVVGLKV